MIKGSFVQSFGVPNPDPVVLDRRLATRLVEGRSIFDWNADIADILGLSYIVHLLATDDGVLGEIVIPVVAGSRLARMVIRASIRD